MQIWIIIIKKGGEELSLATYNIYMYIYISIVMYLHTHFRSVVVPEAGYCGLSVQYLVGIFALRGVKLKKDILILIQQDFPVDLQDSSGLEKLSMPPSPPQKKKNMHR